MGRVKHHRRVQRGRGSEGPEPPPFPGSPLFIHARFRPRKTNVLDPQIRPLDRPPLKSDDPFLGNQEILDPPFQKSPPPECVSNPDCLFPFCPLFTKLILLRINYYPLILKKTFVTGNTGNWNVILCDYTMVSPSSLIQVEAQVYKT